MLYSLIDLEGRLPAVAEDLAALGDDAQIWRSLRMAALRPGVELPPSVSSALERPAYEVNRDRRGVLAGLDLLVQQAGRHREAVVPAGNAQLAQAAGGTTAAQPEYDAEGRLVEGRPRPTRLGFMSGINLSIGVGAPGDFDPSDPVNIATERAARAVPIVMAAGNARNLRRGPGAYSKWAKAPWVISVTALRDGTLATDSAYADAADSSYRPAVAAADDRLTVFHVDTGRVEAHRGTSFAAVVVSNQLYYLAAFCLTVRSAVQEHLTGHPEGVPRVGLGFVDQDIDPGKLSGPSWPYGALPVLGVSHTGAGALAEAGTANGLTVDLMPDSTILRRLLLASAQPVAGLDDHQVGAGEVSDGSTAVFLARLTTGDYLRAALGDSDEVSLAAEGLAAIPMTDDTLPAALERWQAAGFVWAWDFRRATELWNLTFVNKEGQLQ